MPHTPLMLAVIKLGNPMRHYTMMKLRTATGLGLVLFMATMIGGPAGVSQAQADDAVTLASLAGKFAGRGSGFFTFCFNGAALISCSSVSPVPSPVPYNQTQISQQTRDAAGNACEVFTRTYAPVFGTTSSANVATPHRVFTSPSFDPTTGSGTANFSQYRGGNCVGAAFDSMGATLVNTGTVSFVASDSGNRIEFIITGFSQVNSAFGVAGSVKGFVFSATYIRQGHQSD